MNFRTYLNPIRVVLAAASFIAVSGQAVAAELPSLSTFAEKTFAVPEGTIADKLVSSRFPQAKFEYYRSVSDAAAALGAGKVDVVAYDEPILKNIAAKSAGELVVLPEMLTVDEYGFGVRPGDAALKQSIDTVLAALRKDGVYAAMRKRWLPDSGAPAVMPEIPLTGKNGVLRLGTAAVTEPFSFVDARQQVTGFDIELAHRIAQQQGKTLEIVNMGFGELIPALLAGKVDLIGACITISPERSEKILFSDSYYTGGIGALVHNP